MVSASVSAQELPIEIAWHAPPECPDADAVRGDLDRIVRVEPGRTPPALSVEGRIAREGESYRLDLTIVRDGEPGTRSLTATECADLLRGATLVLALSLGEGVAIRSDAEPAPSEPQPPEPPVVRPPPPAPTSIEREPSSIRASLGLHGGIGSGLVPGIAPRVAIDGSLGERGWRARLSIASDVFGARDLPAGVRAELSAIEGRAGMCFAPGLSTLRIELCAEASLALVLGRSRGATDDGFDSAWLGLYGGSVAVAIPIGPLEIVGRANVAGAPVRPVLAVRGLGEAHRVSAVAISGTLGIALGL
jgi:hypothetical protein